MWVNKGAIGRERERKSDREEMEEIERWRESPGSEEQTQKSHLHLQLKKSYFKMPIFLKADNILQSNEVQVQSNRPAMQQCNTVTPHVVLFSFVLDQYTGAAMINQYGDQGET